MIGLAAPPAVSAQLSSRSTQVSTMASVPASATAAAPQGQPDESRVDLKPLLTRMWPLETDVAPTEIAEAVSHFFTNRVTEAQAASLLVALHFTGLDVRADVLATCAGAMLQAAAPIPVGPLTSVLERRGRKEGNYRGGLVSVSSPSAAALNASSSFIVCCCLQLGLTLFASATSSARAATLTTPSTSVRRPPSLPLPYSSSPSTATGPAHPGLAAPT